MPVLLERHYTLHRMHPEFQALMSMMPVQYGRLPRLMPERGIYLFSDGDDHLYAGRTNRIRRRLSGHCRPSSTHFSATFAFRMARQETGFLKASYAREGSRSQLASDDVFGPVFSQAKARLATMDTPHYPARLSQVVFQHRANLRRELAVASARRHNV